jgi:hypothetical protein
MFGELVVIGMACTALGFVVLLIRALLESVW